MKKAYIILAHKNAAQVTRLIDALDDNYSTFFLHIDKKAAAAPFHIVKKYGDKVIVVKSVPTPWGGYGLVEATLQSMKAVINHDKHFDFISLISGQHYPTKSKQHIHEFLCSAKHSAFIEYTAIPNYERWTPRGGLFRIDRYFFGLKKQQLYASKTLNFLLRYTDFLKRKFPEGMKPYGGSQWWTIDYRSLQYILHFIERNEDYTRFHQHTFAPDELFFHTILLNATDNTVRDGITNNNLLYMNWAEQRKAHPEVLTCFDYQNIVAADTLFARKFDTAYDAVVLDMIDEHIGRKIMVPE